MANFLSRRQIAKNVTARLLAGDDKIIEELAALLIFQKRQREVHLLVRDIEDQLSTLGQLIVTVEAAHELDQDLKQQIRQLFPDKDVKIRQIINPDLIGGCKITTPTQILDASIAKKLKKLKAIKI